MIDISHKRTSLRYARARGTLNATPEIIERVRSGTVPKGDVASVARSAGILAAKRASEWLVFCHSMPVDWVEVRMELQKERIVFIAEVRSVWKTGMEMEAMTAVSVALLNAYDMLKPLKEDLSIGEIRLEEKRGGKSDMADRFPEGLRAAIVIVSTEKKEGKRADRAGDAIRGFLSGQPVTVTEDVYVEQDAGRLADVLMELSDEGAGRDAGSDLDNDMVSAGHNNSASEGESDKGGSDAGENNLDNDMVSAGHNNSASEGESDKGGSDAGGSDKDGSNAGESDRPVGNAGESDRPDGNAGKSDRPDGNAGKSDRPDGNAGKSDRERVDLVFICGATGPAPGDITAQVIRDVSDKLIPGIGEAMRSYGYQRTPFAMLSEQVAGLRGNTLLLAIPGSQRGAEESLNALFPGILHLFRMLRGS